MIRHRKKKRNMLRVFFFAVTGIFVGYSMYLINARAIGREPLPMPFGYGQAVVMSGSMSPAFEVDALLIYHEQEEYEVGDMVAFLDYEGDLVTHRIIQIDGETVVTKGDANPIADVPIKKDKIYGKVIHIIPDVGKIVRILQKPELVLVLILLLFAGLEWNYRQDQKAARRRLENQRQELEELQRELKEQQEKK